MTDKTEFLAYIPVYGYDAVTGEYNGTYEAAQSPLDPPGVYLVPANCTMVEPMAAVSGKAIVWCDGSWEQVVDNRGTVYYSPEGAEERITLPGISPDPSWSTTPPPPLPPPPLTIPQQAATLLSGNVVITSTGTPAVNGTYAIDLVTQSHIMAEMQVIGLKGTFADGTSTVVWPDVSGGLHTFPNTTLFTEFALAIAAFYAAGSKAQNGVSTTLPSAEITIS